MSRLLVNPFDFELAAGRNLAFLLLLVAAILSPNITMPGGLPAIRIEQILLAGYLPLLGLHYWNHRELWRVGTIDVAFMALAVAMAVTLVLAPAFLSAVSWSVRDPFELARVAEYWFLFRLGLSLEPKRGLTDALVVLPTLGALLGLLALVQYLDPGGFNGAVTSIWFAVADSNQEALHLFLMFMSLSLIFWLMSYIKRKHTICTLCKGTPLLNSGSLVHVRAKRLPPLNHGTTALASIIFSQKYRCMFCGEDYDLLKKKHRHY